MALMLPVHVGATGAGARDAMRAGVHKYYRNLQTIFSQVPESYGEHLPRLKTINETVANLPYEKFCREQGVFGDAAEVIDRLQAARDDFGLSQIHLLVRSGQRAAARRGRAYDAALRRAGHAEARGRVMLIEAIDVYWVRIPLAFVWKTSYADQHVTDTILVRMESGGQHAWARAARPTSRRTPRSTRSRRSTPSASIWPPASSARICARRRSSSTASTS